MVGTQRMAASTALCAWSLACGGDTTEPEPSTTGAIRVTVSATGTDIAETYRISVSGQLATRSVTGAATATIVGLPPGEYSVRVDAAPNCRVVGDNPRTVVVAVGDTTSVSVPVTCTAAFGSVHVTTRTTGIDIDPKGYAVRAQGFTLDNKPYQDRVSIAPTGDVTITRVPAGDQRMALIGLPFNCNPIGLNPRTISIAPAETAAIAFDVVCDPATAQLAFVAGTDATQEIHVSNADGTGDRAVTANRFADAEPAWSPDGARLAFTTNRDGNSEIYVMDADGSNPVRLTANSAQDSHPTWSPDGTRIAFVSTRFGNANIFVMNADGTNVGRLTTNASRDTDPAWSPDGRSIAFTSDRDGQGDIYLVDVAAASVTRVTTDGGRHPAWSPDGTGLAYAPPTCPGYPFACQPAIFVRIGTQAPRRIADAYVGERPAWSPDGRRVAFDRLSCDFYFIECTPAGVYVATVDGTDAISSVTGHGAAWRPRGRP